MRKFLITHADYSGEVVLVYDEQGRLSELNFSATDMGAEARHYFKAKVACRLANIAAKFDAFTTIIEADYEVSLDDFVHEYPYKRNTHLLPAIWKKMSKTEQLKAVAAAKGYAKFGKRQGDWYNYRIAASWLKNKEYLNDWKKL